MAATANGSNPEAGEGCRAASGRALATIRERGHVFIDSNREILTEYIRALKPGQPEPGNVFIKWLLENEWVTSRVTHVELTPTPGGATEYSELPAPPAGVTYDPSDQKFLAVAAAHVDHPEILQSFDSKWWGWKAALETCSVTVHFVCPAEIQKKYEEKMG